MPLHELLKKAHEQHWLITKGNQTWEELVEQYPELDAVSDGMVYISDGWPQKRITKFVCPAGEHSHYSYGEGECHPVKQIHRGGSHPQDLHTRGRLIPDEGVALKTKRVYQGEHNEFYKVYTKNKGAACFPNGGGKGFLISGTIKRETMLAMYNAGYIGKTVDGKWCFTGKAIAEFELKEDTTPKEPVKSNKPKSIEIDEQKVIKTPPYKRPSKAGLEEEPLAGIPEKDVQYMRDGLHNHSKISMMDIYLDDEKIDTRVYVQPTDTVGWSAAVKMGDKYMLIYEPDDKARKMMLTHAGLELLGVDGFSFTNIPYKSLRTFPSKTPIKPTPKKREKDYEVSIDRYHDMLNDHQKRSVFASLQAVGDIEHTEMWDADGKISDEYVYVPKSPDPHDLIPYALQIGLIERDESSKRRQYKLTHRGQELRYGYSVIPIKEMPKKTVKDVTPYPDSIPKPTVPRSATAGNKLEPGPKIDWHSVGNSVQIVRTLKQKYPGIRRIDFGKIDQKSVAELAEALDEHMMDFPEISRVLTNIGTYEAVKNWTEGGSKGKDDFIMAYTWTTHTLKFREEKILDPLRDTKLAVGIYMGFHPPGTKSLKSYFDHEIGHALDELLRLRTDPNIIAMNKRFCPDRKTAEMTISSYGASVEEFIAECWTEYRNNPTPRECAKMVGEYIEKKYKLSFGVK